MDLVLLLCDGAALGQSSGNCGTLSTWVFVERWELHVKDKPPGSGGSAWHWQNSAAVHRFAAGV